jgi:hypothetical protein
MPPKKKKKQQKKKQTLPNETRHGPFGIKKWLQKQNNIKGERFYGEKDYDDIFAKLNQSPTPQVLTEEELKLEELKNKLKLRYKEISRKNAELSKRYRDLKKNRPSHIFIPKGERGWHEEYQKAIRNDTYRGNYNKFKKDRLTFHRKASAIPGLVRYRGIEFRDAEDSNSDYDLNYSEGNLDEDLNVNDVLDEDIFLKPHINKPPKSIIQHQLDKYFMYDKGDPRLVHPSHKNLKDDIHFEPEVSKPYTKRSEKQYDDYIDTNNSNTLDTWDHLIVEEISFF